LSAKIINNFAAVPSEVDSLNFIATGPCSDDGGCPYKVDWNGFDAEGDLVMEGTYELQISASVDDDTDMDVAYITVVHTENMLKDFEIDKDPVNFSDGEVLAIIFEYNYFETGDAFEFFILDENDAVVKTLDGGTKTGEDGDYWIREIVWDGLDDGGVLVEDGTYTVSLMITNLDESASDTDEMDFAVVSTDPVFEIESLTVYPDELIPNNDDYAAFEYQFNMQADNVTFYILDYDDDVVESFGAGSLESGSYVWDGENVDTGAYKGKVVAEYDGETFSEEVWVNVIEVDPKEDPFCAFPDVAEAHVYCESIEWSKDAGIFEGDPDGNFNPAEVINRAEVLAVVMRAFNLALYDDDGTDLGWSDVTIGEWYMKYLRSGKMYDLLHGDGDSDTVRPEEGIKRVEFLKFIMQAALIDHDKPFTIESCYDSPYSDVAAEQWFTGYVCKSKDLNLFDTYDDLFLPSNGTTRAEVAEALYRMFEEEEWGIFGPPV